MAESATAALGIDFGSSTAKIVAVDERGEVTWHILEPIDPRIEIQVAHFLDQARDEAGYQDGIPIVATGYGRRLIHAADRQVTEISCHARGVYGEYGHGGTLVDIGGQDSKVIAVSPQGKVLNFAMNDKCAAGTGRFLENMANRLNIPIEYLGEQALSTSEEASITSTCTVFAESEVISLISHGVPLESILRGLHRSLVKRLAAMIHSVGVQTPLMISGGVAHNPAIRSLLEDELGEGVIVPGEPQLVGAYGAALLALET